MTESEARSKIKNRIGVIREIAGNRYDVKTCEDLEIAVRVLKEIREYRQLEKRLNGISVEQVVNGFINQVEKEINEGYERGRILTNKETDEWEEYQAIGTVEEFKALKEKNVAKKPIIHGLGQRYCPVCKCGGADHFYCARCGQKLG